MSETDVMNAGPGASRRSPNPWLAKEKDELIVLLSLPGMTGQRLRELMTLFGSPGGALEAIRAGAADGTDTVASEWRDASLRPGAGEMAGRLLSEGISVAVEGEQSYPALLAQTHDPPVALFCKGEPPGERKCVAIVGSRKATPYGLEAARWFAEGLAREGICVVSGAAYGIDSAAHGGAFEAGGKTCGVLGCGVDVVYPRANAGLFRRIEESGCLVSEYPSGTQPRPHFFPARNRIISGISLGVIVVEASERSGALITADFALAENREVFAVPGQVFSANSAGTHALVRSGAALVTGPGEVLEELGLAARPATVTPALLEIPVGVTGDGKALLEALEGGPCDMESLSRKTGLPASRAMAALSSLEVRGLVARAAGGFYQKCRPRL